MMPMLRGGLLATIICGLTAMAALAEPTCTTESLADAIDETGASLRSLSAEAQPKLSGKLVALGKQRGWPEEAAQERGLALIRDEVTRGYERMTTDLLARIDELGQVSPGASVTCDQEKAVRVAATELLDVMRKKAQHMNQRIEAELGDEAEKSAPAPRKTTAAPAPADSTPQKGRSTAAATREPASSKQQSATKVRDKPAEKPKKKASKSSKPKVADWATSTEPAPPVAGPPQVAVLNVPQPSLPYPPERFPIPEDRLRDPSQGFTIEEIKAVSRGLFGTISSSLAGVIEHAFRKSGRPTAYVIGKEGGAALLAGVRYGEGTMYLRRGGTQKVYWHGPSIGSDVGAEGSRTLFLIYHLHEPDGVFRLFSGVSGSAYVIGGVGMTFLKGGKVLMAPIRSGLGLRVGASIGYVRFTPRPTWNPF